jgi:hypothetical protein
MKRSKAYRRFRFYVKKRWAKNIWKLSTLFLSPQEIEKEEKRGLDTLIGKLATSHKHIKYDNEPEKKHYSRSKQKQNTQMLLREAML